jgi:hypothetical protein
MFVGIFIALPGAFCQCLYSAPQRVLAVLLLRSPAHLHGAFIALPSAFGQSFYCALQCSHGVGSWGLCHSLAIKGKNKIFDFHVVVVCS